MTSNVFTKKDILQNLASRGFFIDIYTLDAFFAKNKIEAIFEDSQGNEFFDKNAFNIVLENLFKEKSKINLMEANPEPIPRQEPNLINSQGIEPELKIDDNETNNLLKNISLSDGTPLIDSVKDFQNIEVKENIQNSLQDEKKIEIQENVQNNFSAPNNEYNTEVNENISKESAPQADIAQSEFNIPVENTPETPDFNKLNENILENTEINNIYSPMQQQQADLLDAKTNEIFSSSLISDVEEANDFDDMTLLSESIEAQEKLRQYVVSELSKKNIDVAPKSNEFKLDISERTLNMIARTMAKKIAKYVGSLMAQDARDSSKIAEYQEENRRLTHKARELEEQNRKLRLLLAESNKNLNSYKPSFFGLYKKVDPQKNKK